jgi:hypothetical protein
VETQHKLVKLIEQSWAEYEEIHAEEKEGGYSDAMLSMERTHAEGYAEGLASAYAMIYGKEYDSE